jgi:anti-anti-sigma factor
MVNCYFQDGHVFARVLGDLTMLNIGRVLEQIQQEVQDRGCWKLILDFSEVPVVDSAAIGSLVKLARLALSNDGYVLIAKPNAHLLEVLYYSKLEKTLRPFMTIEKALDYAENGEQLTVSAPAPKPGE